MGTTPPYTCAGLTNTPPCLQAVAVPSVMALGGELGVRMEAAGGLDASLRDIDGVGVGVGEVRRVCECPHIRADSSCERSFPSILPYSIELRAKQSHARTGHWRNRQSAAEIPVWPMMRQETKTAPIWRLAPARLEGSCDTLTQVTSP